MRIITFKYIGATYKNCDPSAAQKAALSSDQAWQKTLGSSYATVFGAGSAMYKSISSQLDTTIAKGMEQMGFTPQELAAKRSEAINLGAGAAKAAERAIGEKAAVSGAPAGVESGVTQATRAASETAILGKEAQQQADITTAGYDVGRQQFQTAEADKAKLLGESFAPAAQVGGEVTAAEQATAAQANVNAQAQTSWMGLVGGVAAGAAKGLGTAA